MHKIINKPWGKEEWLELNEFYCYKRIYLNAGYKTSLQYHEYKKESNYIIAGEAEVWLENENGEIETFLMGPGSLFNVDPPRKHRVVAITDVILQEVSTPHVDDVFRINDEFNRPDGKIESEHQTQSVLILAAGLGTRMLELTNKINKALLPLNNKAIISHIIEKFDKSIEYVIAVGSKSDSIKDYCYLNHSDRNINFVDVDDFESPNSGPGYSALCCRELLQKPFYFITVDCLILDKIPLIDGNWLSVSHTSFPEKYSTVKVDDKTNNVIEVVNKKSNGYDLAFTGLAAILDYHKFWEELEKDKSGEIISAFKNVNNYPSLKIKNLHWVDTGNYDDYNHAKVIMKDDPLSLIKNNGEITYKNIDKNIFLKFIPEIKIVEGKALRAVFLKNLIPDEFEIKNNFLKYKWENGKTLYEINSIDLYKKFINFLFEDIIKESIKFSIDQSILADFYYNKTKNRIDLFVSKNKSEYMESAYQINGVNHPSFSSLFQKINFSSLYQGIGYEKFHGDLQFDNILYNDENDKFTYIDWRDSFSQITNGGDVYYDLAKLYGGVLISYLAAKKENIIEFKESKLAVNFKLPDTKELSTIKLYLEKKISHEGYDIDKIKLLTSIIFINMSPLHEVKFSKALWFKSIELMNECLRGKIY